MDKEILHKKIMQLKEKIESGKFRFRSPDSNIVLKLQEVMMGDDGLVDPDTVPPEVIALLKATDISES